MKRSSAVKTADTETAMYVIYATRKYVRILWKGRKKQMAKQVSETQKRVKIIEKLIALGVTSEDQVKKLTPNDLVKSEKMSFADILLIYELQDCVKNNKVFSFLAKNDE